MRVSPRSYFTIAMNKQHKKSDSLSVVLLLLLVVLDAFVWREIVFGKPSEQPRIYFLDVGQGDSELVVLPGGIKVMTDAGPDKKVLDALDRIPNLGSRSIDLAVISHPQLDHFNGFQYLLDRYRIGAFISNGRSDTPGVAEWNTLIEKIKKQNIPFIILEAGDAIRYNGSRIDFLSPGPDFIGSGELNDTGFVELVKSEKLKVLLTADTGSNIEQYLLDKFDPSTSFDKTQDKSLRTSLRADILKVGHHGSKFSSSDVFLAAVQPKVAVIEVGAHNRYGHPTKEALARLASSTAAKVFRTDQNGTVAAIVENGKLKVFTEK